MKPRQGKEVVRFIKYNTSIQAFYDFITKGGKNFLFNINNSSADNFETPLIKAIYVNNMPLVHALLEMGADPNQSYTYHEQTPLHDAIEAKNLAAVKELVEHGAYLDVPVDALEDNSLLFAKKVGDIEIIKYISENIPVTEIKRINSAYKKEYYELVMQFQEAVLNKNIVIAENILNFHCLNLNRIQHDMQSRYTRVAATHCDIEMVKLLAKHHDDLIEADSPSNQTTPQYAFAKRFWHISDFLQKEQNKRYEILKKEADKQTKLDEKLLSEKLLNESRDRLFNTPNVQQAASQSQETPRSTRVKL